MFDRQTHILFDVYKNVQKILVFKQTEHDNKVR